ncbi:MAG: SDR family NAD(P)-dependent oxidoreductase [Nitriliruptorales bacterium]|nr:SDR family NAD(P)-dependent oxidoreductase [Nitriliruptorales bacterium]
MAALPRLEGKHAVVTGAGGGIGRAIAHAFAAEGADVVCAGRRAETLEDTAALAGADAGRVVAAVTDVCDDRAVAQLLSTAMEAMGSVDILVNNAGVYAPGRFVNQSLDDWRAVFEVNVFGVVRATQAFLPPMLDAGSGRIINIASTAGKYGSLFQSPYNASKHAVVGLTKCLALETAGAGVTVNAICPGFVGTDMISGDALEVLAKEMGVNLEDAESRLLGRVPIGRYITPQEVAELAVYVASDAAAGMTGSAVTLAGGLVLI